MLGRIGEGLRDNVVGGDLDGIRQRGVLLIPLGLAYWVVRTRTVIDADAIEVRRALTKTRIPWSAVASLRVREQKWVRAVLADGTEIALPSVHTRHLSALAVISNGRIPDPLADRESAPEPAADNGADDSADAGGTSSTAEQGSAPEEEKAAE